MTHKVQSSRCRCGARLSYPQALEKKPFRNLATAGREANPGANPGGRDGLTGSAYGTGPRRYYRTCQRCREEGQRRKARYRIRAHDRGLCESCHQALSDDEQALGARSCRECKAQARARARKSKARVKSKPGTKPDPENPKA